MKSKITRGLFTLILSTISIGMLLWIASCQQLGLEKDKDNSSTMAIAALAANSSSSASAASAIISCTSTPSNGTCTELPASFAALCQAPSVQGSSCSAGQVGKCLVTVTGSPLTQNWYYYSPNYTTATAQTACATMSGTFTAGTGTETTSAPSALTYTGSPYSFAKGTAITTQTPTVTGTITSCTASPTLPTGLSIATTTCAISGTPTANQAATSYTVTATNSAGSTTATISIAIGFTVTLSLEHSSATGANKFTAALFNSAGQRVGGIANTTTLTASKTYSGKFKSYDGMTGVLSTTTDATVDNGTYSMAVYVDTDGSNTVTLAGDKAYAGIGTVNGNITSTLTNTNLVTPNDLTVQYTGGGLTNTKTVFCFPILGGNTSMITSAATFQSAIKMYAFGAAGGIVGASTSGNFVATITTFQSFPGIGTTWGNSNFMAPASIDVACYVDTNANNTPDVGEPYFKTSASAISSTLITVTSSGNLP